MGYVQDQLQEYAGRKRIRKQGGNPVSLQDLKHNLRLEVEKWAKEENKKQEKSPPPEDEKDKQEHSPFLGELKAVLWKNSLYRKNTAEGLDGRGGKDKVFKVEKSFMEKAYEDFPKLIDVFVDYYPYGAMACNFNTEAKYKGSEKKVTKRGGATRTQSKKKGKNANCTMPYKWNAHHMIPGSAFYSTYVVDGNPVEIFTQEQYYLLLMSDYDVNNGNNMIPLPDAGWDFFQPVHKMLLHPSGHPNYTRHVQKKLKEIAKKLDQIKGDADKPHPNVSVKVAKDIVKIENKCWKLLHQIGEENVTAYVEKRKAVLTKEQAAMVGDKSGGGNLI